MNITVLGAAREVTASCSLVKTTGTRFLVDCGRAQGGREAPVRNREPFASDPKSIDFVLLIHAHIDPSGLLPKLTRAGFQGPIQNTAATAYPLRMTLPDSVQVQEDKAEQDKRYGSSAQGSGAALTPRYALDDARDCLPQMRPIAYGQQPALHGVARCRFRDAGHILGSAIIQVWITGPGQTAKLVFSGDLGQPTPIEDADIVIMESTDGNRAYKDLALSQGELFGIADRTLRECGVPTTGFQAQG